MSGKNDEISAEEAAILLGVHSRTIRNLIQRRSIRASKVKGRWYIDKASVLALKASGVELEDVDAPRARLIVSTLQGPRMLAAYRLCLHGFGLLPDLKDLPPETRKRCELLQLDVIQHLGAGHYSYGNDKQLYYARSRSALGGLLALLYPYQKPELNQSLSFLEDECVRALSSLIRKMDTNKGKKVHEPAAALQ